MNNDWESYGKEEVKVTKFRKDFTHHDNWFYVLEHIIKEWKGDRRLVHVPKNLISHKMFYHYIAKHDELYEISRESILEYRFMYNGRFHVATDRLTRIEITPEWRAEIEKYKR